MVLLTVQLIIGGIIIWARSCRFKLLVIKPSIIAGGRRLSQIGNHFLWNVFLYIALYGNVHHSSFFPFSPQ